jgi:UDP-N-acetylmuramoylalanine-D-glutamate ligase
VTQNHLDRHHTFENYVNAKARLFETQRAGDLAVLNADDPVTVGSPNARPRRRSGSAARTGFRRLARSK